eukprot:14754164-Heterocapsa_arctica.AAC.1
MGPKKKRSYHMQEIANDSLGKQQVSSRKSAPIMGKPAAPTNKRRTIPWRILEIFTWLCSLSMMTVLMNWRSLESFNLTRRFKKERARDWIEHGDLDLLVSNWSCCPWNKKQGNNQRVVAQRLRLRAQQGQRMHVFRVTKTVAHHSPIMEALRHIPAI